MWSFIRSCVLVLVLVPALCFAQESNVARGKVFWLGFMQNYEGAQDLRLFIASDAATTGVVSVPGMSWEQNVIVPANGVAEVTLPLIIMHNGSEFIDNKAVLISMQDSCTVSALNFQNFTADASMIMPLHQLGREYLVHAYKGLQSYTYQSELLIVCAADSALVEITPSCPTAGGQQADVPFTLMMHEGDSYEVQAQYTYDDLSGTRVRDLSGTDCHPLAVFGGSVCPNIPIGCYACDHVFEQNVPVDGWGRQYYVTPFNGQSVYTLQLMTGDASADILKDGSLWMTLMPGSVLEVNEITGAHCYSSDIPFSMAMYMEGNSCDGGNGDPSMLVVNKDEDLSTQVTFATVITPSITQQWVNIVTTPAGASSMYLDGIQVDPSLFSAFPSCGDRSWASLSLTSGSHTLSAADGFTGFVYGTGPNYETYAYSIGSRGATTTDELICSNGEQLVLQAPGWMNTPYWYVEGAPNDTLSLDLSLTVAPDTDVVIVASRIGGSACIEEKRFRIAIVHQFTLDLSTDPAPMCIGDTTTLTASVSPASPEDHITWSPLTSVAQPHQFTTAAYPGSDTWFVAKVTSDHGCSSVIDSFQVLVHPLPTPQVVQQGDSLYTSVYDSYAWYLDGLPLGATGQSLQFPMSGTYTVLVTDANGCSAMSPGYVALVTDVSEVSGPQLIVNATNRTIHLRADAPLKRIEVFDALGQRIGSERRGSTVFDLPVQSFGVYSVRVTDAMGMVRQARVVVE